MSVEENKVLVRRFIEELFNKGDLSFIPEFTSPGLIFVNPMGVEYKEHEGMVKLVTSLRKRSPDLHVTIEDIFGEGDKVATRERWHAPSQKIDITCVMFYRFEGGKCVEAVEFIDMLRMYQQWGVPPPGYELAKK